MEIVDVYDSFDLLEVEAQRTQVQTLPAPLGPARGLRGARVAMP